MISISQKINDFIKKFSQQVGIKNISEKELLKIMKYFDIIKNDENINVQEIGQVSKLGIVDHRIFMNNKSDFSMGADMFLCKKKPNSSMLYEKRKKGQVIGIYDDYVVIKLNNYNESILYKCMDIGEYLIFSI